MQAVVDRNKTDYAVLLFGIEKVTVDVPVMLVPEGTREGRT